jgi:hypothetical protein
MKGEKTWCSQLACWPGWSACYSNWPFFPFVYLSLYMLRRLKLTLFTLQSSPLFFLWPTRSKPLWTKTCSFKDVVPVNQAVTASFWTCVLSCYELSPEHLSSPLKSRHFLSEVGQQSFERLTLLVFPFIWQIILLFSSKPGSYHLRTGNEARDKPTWMY